MDIAKPKRGLSALLAATSSPAHSAASGSPISNSEVPLNEIRTNPHQPRTDFDPQALLDLSASIKTQGVIQPLVVRILRPDEITGVSKYELIAGERRWRASQMAGLLVVPVVMKNVFDERDILLLSLVENLQRDDLNAIDEAQAYSRLVKSFNLSHEQVAAGVGKSRASVSNMIRLLELPTSIQEAVKSRRLSVGHAKVLLSISDPKLQSQMAAKIQAEYFSVRDLERLVAGGFETPQGVPELSGNQKVANPTSKVTAPQVQDMERRLTEHFGTRVTIEQSLRRGKIQIEFYSVEDFQRILNLISPSI